MERTGWIGLRSAPLGSALPAGAPGLRGSGCALCIQLRCPAPARAPAPLVAIDMDRTPIFPGRKILPLSAGSDLLRQLHA